MARPNTLCEVRCRTWERVPPPTDEHTTAPAVVAMQRTSARRSGWVPSLFSAPVLAADRPLVCLRGLE